MPDYQFNTKYPPLLKDVDNVLDIDPKLLRKDIGEAEYENNVESLDKIEQRRMMNWIIIRKSKIKIKRYQKWTIFDGPIHYAEDFVNKLQIRNGYTEDQKKSFEHATETTVGTNVGLDTSLFKFNASVTDRLRITDDLTKTWVLEEIRNIEQTFKAGNTYITWRLYDIFDVVRDTAYYHTVGGKDTGTTLPEHVETSLQCVFNQYQDKIADEQTTNLARMMNIPLQRQMLA